MCRSKRRKIPLPEFKDVIHNKTLCRIQCNAAAGGIYWTRRYWATSLYKFRRIKSVINHPLISKNSSKISNNHNITLRTGWVLEVLFMNPTTLYSRTVIDKNWFILIAREESSQIKTLMKILCISLKYQHLHTQHKII